MLEEEPKTSPFVSAYTILLYTILCIGKKVIDISVHPVYNNSCSLVEPASLVQQDVMDIGHIGASFPGS